MSKLRSRCGAVALCRTGAEALGARSYHNHCPHEHSSSGKQIGKLVAEKLGIPFYYKEMSALAAHESGLDQEFISDVHKNSPDILRELYLSTRVVQDAIGGAGEDHKEDRR